MLRNFCLIFILVGLFSACESNDKLEAEIAEIPVDLRLQRFDKDFAQAKPQDLPRLKKEYSYLFPKSFPDSVWLGRMNDTIQHEINREVAKAFPDFEEEKQEIKNLFKHLKFYFDSFKTPQVVTITSEVDYHNKVVAADSLLLISLDTYLGKDHKFYQGIEKYIRKNFRKEQITPDIVFEYGRQLIPNTQSRTLLASMIYYGKILYLKDKLLPKKSNHEKIGYTEEEIAWAQNNEEQIWRYFVERELLYSTDTGLQKRFINLAPFTKFRLQLDSESPPQLGQYIGWQIVRQFMEKNEEITLPQLLKLDAEYIFKNSNYKPRR